MSSYAEELNRAINLLCGGGGAIHTVHLQFGSKTGSEVGGACRCWAICARMAWRVAGVICAEALWVWPFSPTPVPATALTGEHQQAGHVVGVRSQYGHISRWG